jgi:hypothetical protein
MAELDGKRLALDDGGRPRVDDGGRLVYVDVAAGEELPEQLEDGQGVHTPQVIDPADLHPENTQPVVPADADQG